jgi:hypothetical protein
VPLVESRSSSFTFLGRYMRREMKFFVINTLNLKPFREIIMISRDRTASQDMNLGLNWDGWTSRSAEDINAVVRCQEWISPMSKSSSLLIRVEAKG